MTLVRLPHGIDIEHADPRSIDADAEFWRIYEESFPAAERDPRAVVLATADAHVGFVLRARSHDATVGLAVVHMLRQPAVGFLVYLAVDSQSRSHGLGSSLLATAETFGAGQFDTGGQTMQGMIWEIDDPADEVTDDERTIRVRRRRFFERAGGRMLDVSYLQPPINGHSIVPMRLMYKPRSGPRIPDGIDAREIVRAIYGQKYGAMNGIPGPILEKLMHRTQDLES